MRYSYCLIFMVLLFSCESDDINRNPFIPDVSFRFDLNLNLPLYNDLNIIGSPIYVDNAGVGVRGAFVMRTGPSDQFVAWEANCPNQAPNNCSTMVLEGQNASCPCDDYEYNLFFGQLLNPPQDGSRFFNLKPYRAVLAGNSVIISN
ncbi:hypothetical protein [Croceivirga thetidis]|nr:hypothetical protein [Croceivirga thetidis]